MIKRTSFFAFGSVAAGLVILALLDSTPARAADLNGFLREKGRADVALSYTSESYDRFWVGTASMDVPNGGDVDTTSLSLWFAYGITDDLTLTGDVPYIDVESDGFDMSDSGVQDLTLLAEYRFASIGSQVLHDFIGAGGFRTPLSDYDPNQPVDLGDGTTDALFRFVYQLRVGGFYFSQQVGYDLRNEDAPDNVPLYSEAGYTWGPVTFSGSYWVLRARGGTDIMDPGFTFPSNAEEYRRAGLKVYGRITGDFGVSGTYYTTQDGRNTGDASGFSLGVNYGF